MTVVTESGRSLTIPVHHPVFTPLGNYAPGDEVDPLTVEVVVAHATALSRGRRIIIDNKVEVVAAVAPESK